MANRNFTPEKTSVTQHSADLDWRQARDSFTITGNTVVNREQAVPEQSFLYMHNGECKEHSLAMFIWTAKGVGGL